MPWSEWRLDPVENSNVGALRYASTATYGSDTRAAPGNSGEQIDTIRNEARIDDSGEARTQIISPFISNDVVSSQQKWTPNDLSDPTKSTAIASLGWRIGWWGLREGTVRRMFPYELMDMTEGVDYMLRPDRDGSEHDAYIEYEDEKILMQPSDITGWQGSVTLSADAYKNNTEPILVAGRAWLTDEPLPIPPESTWGEYTTTPVVPIYESGTDIIRLPEAGEPGAVVTGTFTYPAATTLFTLVVNPDFTTFLYDNNAYLGNIAIDHDIRWTVQYPRWRYWIPDSTTTKPKPLRQKQRDDGLGRSVVRARSTHSVQMSLRQKGYR